MTAVLFPVSQDLTRTSTCRALLLLTIAGVIFVDIASLSIFISKLNSYVAHISVSVAGIQSSSTIHNNVRQCTSFALHANGVHARLQPILISRFLLNLRHADSPEDSTSRLARFPTPLNFRAPTLQSIVGNMGEPLDHGYQEDTYEDEGEGEGEGDVTEVEAPGSDCLSTVTGEGTGAGPSGGHQWEDGGVQEVRRYRPPLRLEFSFCLQVPRETEV